MSRLSEFSLTEERDKRDQPCTATLDSFWQGEEVWLTSQGTPHACVTLCLRVPDGQLPPQQQQPPTKSLTAITNVATTESVIISHRHRPSVSSARPLQPRTFLDPASPPTERNHHCAAVHHCTTAMDT